MRLATIFLLCLTLVSGCTDLTAVSNFAKSGADATNGADVFAGFVAARANQVRLAFPPTDHPTPEQIQLRQAALALQAKAPADAAANQAGLKALSLYLTVLGALSSDTLIDVTAQAGSIGASLGTLGATPSGAAGPAGSLLQFLVSAPLDAWRNRAVGNLIQGADKDVLLLCADLSTAAQAVGAAWGTDIAFARAYYGAVPGRADDIRGSIMMMALANQEATGFEANRQRALALGVALDQVCRGQKALAANVDKLDLSTVSGLLAGYQAEIQSAGKLVLK